jgi:Domain of unknown function (DUF4188)
VAGILEGRWTATVDGDFVVFLIGAQVRKPWRALRAIPLLGQMRAMLADLEKTAGPESGFLGYQAHGVGPFGVIVQYWRSFEDLERFARAPGDRHAKVWRDWYRAAQHKNSAVGIWHESFAVTGGRYEAIYQNMPAIGLLKAGEPQRVGRRADTARDRLGEAAGPETAPLPVPRDAVDTADAVAAVD